MDIEIEPKTAELPPLEKMPVKEERFDEVKFIRQRIYDAKDALAELDLKRARAIYVEVMSSYNKLKEKDKAKVYYDVNQLYYDRKNAESMFSKK